MQYNPRSHPKGLERGFVIFAEGGSEMNGITMLICWLSIPAVSKDLKLSESTTRSVLNDLRKAGLVPTEQRFRENGGIAVCSILWQQGDIPFPQELPSGRSNYPKTALRLQLFLPLRCRWEKFLC